MRNVKRAIQTGSLARRLRRGRGDRAEPALRPTSRRGDDWSRESGGMSATIRQRFSQKGMTPTRPSSTEEKVDAIPGKCRLQLHVGEDETLVVLRAFEIHVEGMTRRAVGAVATDDPRRFYRLFAPVGVTQDGAHGVACLRQARQLDAALHCDPERIEMFAEQTLGLGLRQAQSERERARDGSELDPGDLLVTMMEREPVEPMARLRRSDRRSPLSRKLPECAEKSPAPWRSATARQRGR